MKAQRALEISLSVLPLAIETEYKNIIDLVMQAAMRGETHINIGSKRPREEVVKKIWEDGYMFYSLGEGRFKEYGITWKHADPKRKWYERIFS